ncbi:PREDICTED: uncharacterized protein LOC108618661 [Drosophila arizonae]|uniref:Uncharacterized protein LOC108618661 n=1 Tax=Drosophila arizonae TaxID=7263 RepID=A0ABM1PSQ5_DROAR|nr:PREDICTED: uncharacterized protein LOC108618661 [Drosophila arizonae]
MAPKKHKENCKKKLNVRSAAVIKMGRKCKHRCKQCQARIRRRMLRAQRKNLTNSEANLVPANGSNEQQVTQLAGAEQGLAEPNAEQQYSIFDVNDENTLPDYVEWLTDPNYRSITPIPNNIVEFMSSEDSDSNDSESTLQQ